MIERLEQEVKNSLDLMSTFGSSTIPTAIPSDLGTMHVTGLNVAKVAPSDPLPRNSLRCKARFRLLHAGKESTYQEQLRCQN